MSIRRLACIAVLMLQYFSGLLQHGKGQEVLSEGNLNFPAPTLGGMQFWADELFFHQWRIQQNVVTGHYRLLDGNSIRHAWGTFEECQAALERIKRQQHLPPMKGKAVIVLHGLCGARISTAKLSEYLRKEGRYEVFNVSYPTTQKEIAEHAKTLAKIIDNLEGIEELNFVGHSLGNIVIRHYLNDVKTAEAAPAGAPPPKHPKFGRFVMLGPPNHGSVLARFFAENVIYKTTTGDSGRELGRDWQRLEARLATPDFEFGIIAGGKGDGKGYNPVLQGDNDGIISVETAKLDGAKDFLVIPVLHPLIPDHNLSLACTLRFLRDGSFDKKTTPGPKAGKRR